MAVLCVVVKLRIAAFLEVHKRKQPGVNLLLVEDQAELRSQVHGEEDTHGQTSSKR